MQLKSNVCKPIPELFIQGLDNIFLLKMLECFKFVYLMENVNILLTYSGVQVESQGFGKLVLVMLDTTERLKVVDVDTVKLNS